MRVELDALLKQLGVAVREGETPDRPAYVSAPPKINIPPATNVLPIL